MIVLSLLLLIGSAICLAVGLALDELLLVWISIAASLLAALFLAIGVGMRRSRFAVRRDEEEAESIDADVQERPSRTGPSAQEREEVPSGPVRVRTRKRSTGGDEVRTDRPEGAPMISRNRDEGGGS
jgi:hypothetical protein